MAQPPAQPLLRASPLLAARSDAWGQGTGLGQRGEQQGSGRESSRAVLVHAPSRLGCSVAGCQGAAGEAARTWPRLG